MKISDSITIKHNLFVRLIHKSKQFLSAEDGVTAIEFSIVGLPFFILIMVIFETCLTFFATQALETAVDRPARQIRTGQITAGPGGTHPTADDLKPVICAGGLSLFDCDKLILDVKIIPGFNTPSTPFTGAGNLNTAGMAYEIGAPGSLMMIRVYYEWPIIFDYLKSAPANMSNGKRLLIATSAFRIEG